MQSQTPPADLVLQIFGDSIANGVGASVFSRSWAGLCGAGTTYCTADGAHAADLATVMEEVVVPDANKQYALMIGANDHVAKRRGHPTEPGLFKAFLLQSLVWLLAQRKICETATARVSGTAVYVGYNVVQNAPDATADVLIDGIKVGTLSSAGIMNTFMINANTGKLSAPAAARFGGLSPHHHSVEVILTSPHQNLVVNYIAGSDHSAAPKVLISNIIRMSPAAYMKYSSGDEIVDQFNTIIDGLVTDLTRDGFDIRLVDNHSSIDPATDLDATGGHPNDEGHRKIYQNYKARAALLLAKV